MLNDPIREALLRGEARVTQSDAEGKIWLPMVVATALLASAVFAVASGM